MAVERPDIRRLIFPSIHDTWPQPGVPRNESEKPPGPYFGRRLRMIRKTKGFTQKVLASRCGMHPNTITNLERGITIPEMDTLTRLSIGLNVSVEDLLDKANPNPSPELWAELAQTFDELHASVLKAANILVRLADLMGERPPDSAEEAREEA